MRSLDRHRPQDVFMNRLYRVFATTLVPLLISTGIAFSLGTTQNKGHDPNRPEAVPIVLLPQGFSNPSLSLPPGIYAFVIVNRTGFQSVSIQLERMPGAGSDGPAARQEFVKAVGEKNARTIRSARLTKGTYRLRVEGRPAWVSEIQVR